jgi:hypothetical protein
VLVPEGAYYLVPVRCVAQYGSADPPAARPGEQPSVRLGRDVKTLGHQASHLSDERHPAGTLALAPVKVLRVDTAAAKLNDCRALESDAFWPGRSSRCCG